MPDPKTGQANDRSKQSPYDGGLRTPIMIRWPGHVKPGRSVSLATSLDIAPTLLAAANLKSTPQMSGINLLDEPAVENRTAIFGECFTHNSKDLDHPAASLRWRWVIQDEWKLILPDATNEPKASVELFSILEDPTEQNNEAGSNADKVDAMTGEINAWWPATK